MAPVEIYWFPISPYARTAVLFMKLNKIAYQEHLINIGKGEQKSPEYTKVNPMKKVPALKEGDFILTESVAILQYLSTKCGVPEHWYPKDAKKRAKVMEYILWHGNTIAAHNVFFHVVVQAHLQKQPVDEAKVKDTAAKLHEALDFVENHFLSKNDWLGGSDKISIADIYAYCLLFQQEVIGVEITRNRPKLASWYERCKATNIKVFEELHQPLLELCQQWTTKY